MKNKSLLKLTGCGVLVPYHEVSAIERDPIEIIPLRKEHSCTYYLGENRFKFYGDTRKIHFKENGEYRKINTSFKSFGGKKLYATELPHVVEVDPMIPGLKVIDRRTGDPIYTAIFSRLDGKTLPNILPMPKVVRNEVRWENVVSGVSLIARAQPEAVTFEKVLYAPHSLETDVSCVGRPVKWADGFEGVNKFIPKKRRLYTKDKLINRGKVYGQHMWTVHQIWDGSVINVDASTRVRSLSADPNYPVRMHTTWGPDQIDSYGNDGFELVGSGWNTASYSLFAGISGANAHNAGARFTDVTIPSGATINDLASGTKLEIYGLSGAGTPSVEVRGNDDGGAGPAWTSELPSAMDTTTSKTDITSLLSVDTFNTLDIQDVVQDIIDSPGWSTGDTMKFPFINTAASGYNIIVFKAFNTWSSDAPKLTVVYTEGGGGGSSPVPIIQQNRRLLFQ